MDYNNLSLTETIEPLKGCHIPNTPLDALETQQELMEHFNVSERTLHRCIATLEDKCISCRYKNGL